MKHKLVAGVVAAWCVGIASAVGVVWHTMGSAAAHTTAPRWPTDSVIAPTVGVVNVVMVADPQQPCMGARMAELARLADELGARGQVHVVIVGADASTARAAIETATAIRGARVFVDHDGEEARRFGGVATCSSRVYSAPSAPNRPPPLPSVPAWRSSDSRPKMDNVKRAAI
ncbi:MAG: hypothetical protein SFX73_19120 [Kofleriaceae bacterium]|nr:hypothetical protein [Kofleriaceae bacterium]